MSNKFYFLFILLVYFKFLLGDKSCSPKYFGKENDLKIVCVCNSTYCDEYDDFLPSQLISSIGIVTSTKEGKRFEKTFQLKGDNLNDSEVHAIININTTIQYQKIIGFGGAFTDSFGINMNSLSLDTQKNLMNSYFSDKGSKYTIGRVPMASTDFSERIYSYCDTENDFELKTFNLTVEDFELKIPFIKKAIELTKNNIKLFASPWSAGGWMKTNGKMKGGAPLKGKIPGPFYETWGNYFVKFLEAYLSYDIPFWGVTGQNEPTSGLDPFYGWQTMLFTPETQRDFIKLYLGPKLKNHPKFSDTKIMILDDDREVLPYWADVVLEDKDAEKYIDGIAIHWYQDEFPVNNIKTTYERHKTKFLLATEACNGWTILDRGPKPGYWIHGEAYLFSIIDDINHYVSGWTDWNLALDMTGGPTWAKNNVDSPILINKSEDTFYKNPSFYALAHISKFVKPDAVRIDSTIENKLHEFDFVAFKNPDGSKVLIILNKSEKDLNIKLNSLSSININIGVVKVEKYSFKTIVWI
ncbi:Glucosylceramidase [Strongyloides ratti]|uniref:Glucosylceramidase n=1 Tax=Strongyloides ratti TaxID=34506 RepID=A0A090MYY2_STRRB|nr:Glucosylceramidase [Strongyloides ratti]CEF67979.1 Glucosylceramidase [Strongyloides ratti]